MKFRVLTLALVIFLGGLSENTIASLTIIGSADTPDNASGVDVNGSYAYVADHYGGLQVIDVTNPSNPTIVGSIDSILAYKVDVSDGYAYVAGGLMLYAIDVSAPQNPVLLGYTTPFYRNARDLRVSGGYAYGVYDGLDTYSQPFGALRVIDVRNPQSLIPKATLSTGKGAAGVDVSGEYAYVTDGGWIGLRLINVSNPENPAIGSSLELPYVYKVHVSGDYAYVAGSYKLYVVNVSNPQNPSLVGSVDKPGGAEDVYVRNGYAYVAAGENGLLVIDVSNPQSPTVTGSIDTPGNAQAVDVAGFYAYVADGESGLQVIDLCPNPFSVRYLDPGYRAEDFLRLPFPTAAIAFDSIGDLYTEDATDNASGTINILKLDAATGYSTWSTYASYPTSAIGVNGLAFNGAGSLFVSEFNADKDSGFIRKIDTATQSVIHTIPLPDFRPTGIDIDTSGNTYTPGRLASDPTFGNIYKIDSSGGIHILVAGLIGTGIAVDNSGNILVSTPERDVSPLVSQSLYMYKSTTLKPTLIATFDEDYIEELTFDAKGNLYVFDHKRENCGQKIMKLLLPPKAMPWIPLLLLDD